MQAISRAALAAIVATWVSGSALAEEPAAFPYPVHQKTLANGLTVVAIETDSPGLVAYYTVVRAGSRNEVEPGKSGFAHFFEHMMFRGTERYPEQEYNAVLKRLGADSNAWTWRDQTVYHILAGSESLPTLVDIEADRFMNLTYDDSSFQKEARAVLGEYNKNASNPHQKMSEALCDSAFQEHTYKHTTMGFLKDIEDMPNQLDYSHAFFDRYYRPDNITIVVTGELNPEQLFALTAKHYGTWKPGPERPAVPKEPPQKQEKRVALAWQGPTMPSLLMGFHVPGFSTTDVDTAALDVLSSVVFSKRSPLYRKLVIEEQKVEKLHGRSPANVDPSLFEVRAKVKDAADLAYVERAIAEEFARVAQDGVDSKTLKEIQSHARYDFAAELSTADDIASAAAWFVSLTGDVSAINAYYSRLAQVTNEDVKRVAADYFRPEQRTVVTLQSEVN